MLPLTVERRIILFPFPIFPDKLLFSELRVEKLRFSVLTLPLTQLASTLAFIFLKLPRVIEPLTVSAINPLVESILALTEPLTVSISSVPVQLLTYIGPFTDSNRESDFNPSAVIAPFVKLTTTFSVAGTFIV